MSFNLRERRVQDRARERANNKARRGLHEIQVQPCNLLMILGYTNPCYTFNIFMKNLLKCKKKNDKKNIAD